MEFLKSENPEMIEAIKMKPEMTKNLETKPEVQISGIAFTLHFLCNLLKGPTS
jgi:hypothetical protein